MQTLIINAHPDPQNKTAYCTNRLVDCLTKKLPDATVLNLYNEDIPELTAETLPVFNGAYSGDGKDAELSKGAQHFLARNAELLEQFKAADRVIIAMPMHNFTVTSRLKDYLDNIIVPGHTFQYTREARRVSWAGISAARAVKRLRIQHRSAGTVGAVVPLPADRIWDARVRFDRYCACRRHHGSKYWPRRRC